MKRTLFRSSLVAAAAMMVAPAVRAQDVAGDSPGVDQTSAAPCLGRAGERWVGAQSLVAVGQPQGLELSTDIGLCLPLFTRRGPLFDHTRVQPGIASQATLGYVTAGPYLEIVPVSFFVLRTELRAVGYFSGGVDGTGYHAMASPDAPFAREMLPADSARSMRGWTASIAPTLRAEVPLTSDLVLQASSSAFLERWSLGDAPYYYNVRWDLIMEAGDWLLREESYLVASMSIDDDVSLQLGALSLLAYVPSHESLSHQAGGMLGGRWRDASRLFGEVGAYAAVTAYTHHPIRAGVNVIVGLNASYDLGRR